MEEKDIMCRPHVKWDDHRRMVLIILDYVEMAIMKALIYIIIAEYTWLKLKR